MTAPANPHVLVVNAGSSSLKYQVVDTVTGAASATGLVERIGEPAGAARHEVDGTRHTRDVACPDHVAAFDVLLAAFAEHGPSLESLGIVAVGHRVVHGGTRFTGAVRITDEVVSTIRRLVPLAPLHNPGNLDGITAATQAMPGLPQVAVFDTAFHHTIPPAATTYAVPVRWREEYGVRRYGFHGTSHAYVSCRAAALLDRPAADVNVIVLHLGNGASACAVQGGRSVETSMGLSPLEGLVMGTRPGDLDPAIGGHLARVAGLTAEEFDRALSKESGLLGLTGQGDFRELETNVVAGRPDAVLAFDVVTHRIVKYLGAYAAVLGHVDAIAFTGGVGERSPMLRRAVLERLAILGVRLDEAANQAAVGESRITTADSAVAAYVIPTNEELEIARQVAELVSTVD